MGSDRAGPSTTGTQSLGDKWTKQKERVRKCTENGAAEGSAAEKNSEGKLASIS